MNTTQQHLSIADIADDILILKNGGGALILQVSAVNFGLLSDKEQIAIISSFAQMLNSLSFSIQIVIHSERLNISSYLTLLDQAKEAQTNPLLSQMITDYRQFIQATIKENEVLDKKFYVTVPLFALELGLSASRQILEQKIKTILLPRRDQVIRQLDRVGLKAVQLPRQKLIELFYNIYNGQVIEKRISQPVDPKELAVKLKKPEPVQNNSERLRRPEGQNAGKSDIPDIRSSDLSGAPQFSESSRNSKTHPFVVEELEG